MFNNAVYQANKLKARGCLILNVEATSAFMLAYKLLYHHKLYYRPGFNQLASDLAMAENRDRQQLVRKLTELVPSPTLGSILHFTRRRRLTEDEFNHRLSELLKGRPGFDKLFPKLEGGPPKLEGEPHADVTEFILALNAMLKCMDGNTERLSKQLAIGFIELDNTINAKFQTYIDADPQFVALVKAWIKLEDLRNVGSGS